MWVIKWSRKMRSIVWTSLCLLIRGMLGERITPPVSAYFWFHLIQQQLATGTSGNNWTSLIFSSNCNSYQREYADGSGLGNVNISYCLFILATVFYQIMLLFPNSQTVNISKIHRVSIPGVKVRIEPCRWALCHIDSQWSSLFCQYKYSIQAKPEQG